MSRLRRVIAVATSAVVLALTSQVPAQAHADVVRTLPGAGEDVAQLLAFEIEFTEPITLLPTSLRILDAQGQEVPGDVRSHASGRRLRHDLVTPVNAGTHLATWRVISRDGHPIEGSITFTVGGSVAPGDTLGANLVAAGSPGPADVLRRAATVLTTLGVLVLAGVLWSRRLLGLDDQRRVGSAAIARRVADVALACATILVPLTAAWLSDVPVWRGLAPSQLATLASTSVGLSLFVRVAALAGARWALRGDRRGQLLWAAVALGSLTLDGHTRSGDSAWLLTVSDAVHLAVGALWLGGLIVLAAAWRPTGPDRPHVLSNAIARFSGLAAVSVLVVTATGTLMATRILGGDGAIGATAYGRALIAKVTLVSVVVAIGAYNRTALLPRLRAGTSANRLRRTLRIEAVVLGVAVLLTGALVDLTPPRPTTTVAIGTWVDLGGGLSARVDATLDARGNEVVDLRLVDAIGQPGRVLDVVVLASQPERGIAPLEWPLAEGAVGTWSLTADMLPLAGRWQVDLVVRPSRFERQRRTLVVDVPVVT